MDVNKHFIIMTISQKRKVFNVQHCLQIYTSVMIIMVAVTTPVLTFLVGSTVPVRMAMFH